MTSSLEGRVALVTGAGRGIGKVIAEDLAKLGAHVICVSRSEANCSAVAKGIVDNGGKAEALAVDVSDAAAVQAACEKILAQRESVDILINNAGITRDGLLLRMSCEDWHDVVQTNLSSCFYWAKGLLRGMTSKRWGRIVNMASVVGLMGNAGQTNYAAAKAGIIGFTKALAKEVASRSITVNAVAPGFITTDMTQKLSPEIVDQMKKVIPLKRFGEPADVSAVTTFLCSPAAGYITGQVFTVDGGMVM